VSHTVVIRSDRLPAGTVRRTIGSPASRFNADRIPSRPVAARIAPAVTAGRTSAAVVQHARERIPRCASPPPFCSTPPGRPVAASRDPAGVRHDLQGHPVVAEQPCQGAGERIASAERPIVRRSRASARGSSWRQKAASSAPDSPEPPPLQRGQQPFLTRTPGLHEALFEAMARAAAPGHLQQGFTEAGARVDGRGGTAASLTSMPAANACWMLGEQQLIAEEMGHHRNHDQYDRDAADM